MLGSRDFVVSMTNLYVITCGNKNPSNVKSWPQGPMMREQYIFLEASISYDKETRFVAHDHFI